VTAREVAAVALWDAFDYTLPTAPAGMADVVCTALEAAGFLTRSETVSPPP